MNGYNFTERVRKVLAMSREEAVRLHHEYVGTEHILLGVIREGEGVAATVLQNLDVDLDALENTIESIVKKGRSDHTTGPDLPYTSRAKKVLELAMSEARELNHSYVGTEHLLLGLVREEKGIAAQVLLDSRVTIDNARGETLRILGTEMSARQQGGVQIQAAGVEKGMITMPAPMLSDRVLDIMTDAERVATECHAAELLPIHVAIALLRHNEGWANAVIDRLDCDRGALQLALESAAKTGAAALIPARSVKFGQLMVALHRYVEAEQRWRGSPRGTLHLLLALLDTRPEVAEIFDAHGVNANNVRTASRQMTG